MTILDLEHEDLVVMLTDGYLDVESPDPSLAASWHTLPEPMLAYRLCDQAAATSYVGSHGSAPIPSRPNAAYTWVIGDAGGTWLPISPAPFHLLADDVQEEERYRVVLTAVDTSTTTAPYPRTWSAWARYAGMGRMNDHQRLSDFRKAAGQLLEHVHQQCRRPRTRHSTVVDALGVPNHFAAIRTLDEPPER